MIPISHESNNTLLTVAETAARWKSHPETVKRRIRSGSLPALRFGRGMIRIRMTDILTFEEAQTIQSEQ